MDTPMHSPIGSSISDSSSPRSKKRMKLLIFGALFLVALLVGWYGYTKYFQKSTQGTYDALNARLDQFDSGKPATDEQRAAIGKRLDVIEKVTPITDEKVNAINNRLDQIEN